MFQHRQTYCTNILCSHFKSESFVFLFYRIVLNYLNSSLIWWVWFTYKLCFFRVILLMLYDPPILCYKSLLTWPCSSESFAVWPSRICAATTTQVLLCTFVEESPVIAMEKTSVILCISMVDDFNNYVQITILKVLLSWPYMDRNSINVWQFYISTFHDGKSLLDQCIKPMGCSADQWILTSGESREVFFLS